MEAAKLWAHQGAPHGAIVWADEQTAGRGRHQRTFVSPKGRGVWLTQILHFACGHDVSGLSLVAGLAVVRALLDVGCCNVGLKWPNDLVTRDLTHKIGGILVEASAQAGHTTAFVGVGFNIFEVALSAQKAQGARARLQAALPPSFTHAHSDRPHTVEDAAQKAAFRLDEAMGQFVLRGLAPCVAEFTTYDALFGHAVAIEGEGPEPVQGIAQGVDDDGALLINVGGQQRRIVTGEVQSVRLTPSVR